MLNGITKVADALRSAPQKHVILNEIGKEFDPDHYRHQVNGLEGGERQLLRHYVNSPLDQLRDPTPWFSSQHYLKKNPDVRGSRINPFYHYLVWGRDEKRSAKPHDRPDVIDLLLDNMDFGFYRSQVSLPNGDDRALVEHYLDHGAVAGRNPVPWFSSQYYLDTNPEVAEAGLNPFHHYLVWGKQEGRSASASDFAGHSDCNAIEAMIAPYLDRDFYLDQVDPGRQAEIDPVKHFCAIGWTEGHDPAPDFSTRRYQELNPDVAEQGLNPYHHFLAQGQFEGRARAASTHAPAPKSTARHSVDAGLPRTGVIAMVKNEGDIIGTFAAHLLSMFDEVVFVDHQSDDITREVLEKLANERANVHLYTLGEASYVQDVVSNHVLKTCPALKDIDWVMFLDADEFLPFEKKSDFAAFLAAHGDHAVINFHWKNLIPTEYWEYKVDGLAGRQFLSPQARSPYTKVAIQPGKLAGQDFWVNQGNHAISRAKGMDPLPAWDTKAVLYHLPIRSANQLAIKLNQGVLAYLRRKTNGKNVEGEHWFRILSNINDVGDITPELLNGLTFSYGELDATGEAKSTEALRAAGYAEETLTFAKDPDMPDLPEVQGSGIAELMFRLGGAFARDDADERVVTRLVTEPGNILRVAKDDTGFAYGKLPARSKTEKAALAGKFSGPAETIFTLQTDSYLEIRNLTPTAWGGHLPFMFSLASVLQPRRFVELGSHHGASFLAYCQASERAMSGTQAVAIDCWEGDEQAGFYGNQVFDDFKFMLRPYEGFARYIRDYFDNAVHHFEDGSIDLLHIDGLHTYAAVKNDFDTWLPKMSEEGLIIFHDINVHERDFGVWRLWKELRDVYPSAQFMHSHGLGILYVGSDKASGVRAMVEAMADLATAASLQCHFESVSQLSTQLASQSFTLTQSEEQLKTLAIEAETLTKLRQKSAHLEEENAQLRAALGKQNTGRM